jgi:ABC-type dipeptide/oligopeptide/nickel transport system permease subunit
MADVRAAPALEAPASHEPSRGYWADGLHRLLHSRSGVAGLIIVGLLALLAVVGPMVAPWDYRVQDIQPVRENGGPLPPLSPGHLLGTDRLGRDLFSRTIDGAQISMSVALIAQVVVLLIGFPIGAIAGWRGGRTDTLLMRLTDVVYAFPELLFVILCTSAVVGTPWFRMLNGLLVVFLAIGVSAWVTMARLVRAQVMSLKYREFVEAARATGVPDRRILLRHVMPNAVSPVVVAISIGIPGAILLESTLSFLGLGVQVPRASWGSLIEDGIEYATRWPWLVIPPMVALVITLVGFTLLGDGLRDAFDPRTRRR